jgi:FMN-dependent NADH-azoreductase
MTNLLHIDASILGANSASRQLSAAAVARLRQATPELNVTYRDLAAQPLSHLSADHLAAAQGAVPESAVVQDDIAASQAVLDEFLAADIVVIGAPMYNFSLPSQLKAWIDRIAVAGKTFSYGPNGPQGLIGGKRVIIAVSRGGLYGLQTPMGAMEHVESYLRAVFGFLGATPHFIVAEGLQMGPDQRVKAIDAALEVTTALRAA